MARPHNVHRHPPILIDARIHTKTHSPKEASESSKWRTWFVPLRRIMTWRLQALQNPVASCAVMGSGSDWTGERSHQEISVGPLHLGYVGV